MSAGQLCSVDLSLFVYSSLQKLTLHIYVHCLIIVSLLFSTEMGRVLCQHCHVEFWQPRAYRLHRCAGCPVDESKKDTEVLHDAAAAVENPAATDAPVPNNTGRSNSTIIEDWQTEELCAVSSPPASLELPPRVDNFGQATLQRDPPPMWYIGTPLPDPHPSQLARGPLYGGH